MAGFSREDLVDTASPGDGPPVIQMPPEMQPPTQMLSGAPLSNSAFMLVNTVRAEGFESLTPLGSLAFKVVDPVISGDRPSSMGTSSARA